MEHRQNRFVPASSSTEAGAPRNLLQPDAEPPTGEPRDILAFEPVPLRRRIDGLTPEKQREYVEALADTGVAREAAARVGLTEQSISRVRRRSDARGFDRACEAAQRFGARRLRSIAWERAIEGTLKGHYYHGERVSEERVFDNRLLVYLLSRTEHLLAQPKESAAIADNWEPCMDAIEHARPLPLPNAAAEAGEPEEDGENDQVWFEDGVWWTFFPPPDGFDGQEEGELGQDDYQRTLTEEEDAVMRARVAAKDEVSLARCCAIRDRYFGLPLRGSPGISPSREAEPYEPSGAAPSAAAPFELAPDCDNKGGKTSSEGGSE